MATGLLGNILGMIDRQKQTSKAGFGLLVDNPMEFAKQTTARYFPTKEEETQFAQAQAAGGDYTQTPYYQKIMNLSQFQGSIKPTGLLGDAFNIVKRDASDTFGAGSERIRYIEPKSGGAIEVLSKPDKTASVLSLEVPEAFRGKKIGESLQAKVLQDFPLMQGQVSSKAAAKTAYRLGRRPVGLPNATLDDVFKSIDENSSVNMVSPQMQTRFNPSLLGDSPVQGSIKPTGLLNVPQPQVEPVYHGTTPSAAKAIEKSGFDVTKSADGTVWFTSNPNIGEVAASGKGSVIKRMIDSSKMKLGGWAETDKYSTDELIQMGYDGLKLKDGNQITYQIFNPEKLSK